MVHESLPHRLSSLSRTFIDRTHGSCIREKETTLPEKCVFGDSRRFCTIIHKKKDDFISLMVSDTFVDSLGLSSVSLNDTSTKGDFFVL